MNVKLFSSKYKAALVTIAVLLSSLGLASPAHAKTYKCSKGGSFKVSKGVLFDGKSCKGKAKIPNGVKVIQKSAFFEATSLTSISVPKSVLLIGDFAFCNTSKLKTVKFAKNSKLETIGDSAFNGASALTSIAIPASVTDLGLASFLETKKLKSVTFAKGIKLKSIQESTFSGASALMSIKVPASVTEIGYQAFLGTSNLKSVTFAKASKLKIIEDQAFVKAPKLATIQIPASVTQIGELAFSYSGFTSIDASSSSKSFSSVDGILFNKSKTKLIAYPTEKQSMSYVIPASVTTISGSAFMRSNIENFAVSEGSNSFSTDDGVLYNKSKSVLVAYPPKKSTQLMLIPSSVTTIGSGAFEGLRLQNIVIPDGVSKIESYAFQDNLLTSLIVPSSVTYLGENSFAYNNLTSVKFMGDAPENAGTVFDFNDSLTTLDVPDGSTGWDDYWCCIYEFREF